MQVMRTGGPKTHPHDTDFVGLLQRLDAKQVAFVSVTQHFTTATPSGASVFP